MACANRATRSGGQRTPGGAAGRWGTPALLFSACHGLGFPNGHPLQYTHQGSLLTQEWPGPKQHSGQIPENYYFSADDLSEQARLFGTLVFLFACYGAGTPQLDEFSQAALKDSRAEIAPKPFLAALPQRLLSHPNGSALALVGHVDRAWGYSFYWGSAKRQLAVFESAFNLLLNGFPIGAALDPFNIRYAEISANLNDLLEDISFGKKYEPRELAGIWTANNDARNYVIIGDPAVRMMVAAPGAVGIQQPVLETSAPAGGTGSATLGEDLDRTGVFTVDEMLQPGQIAGRLYSPARDSSTILPNQETIVIGRRDPASASYPDVDLTARVKAAHPSPGGTPRSSARRRKSS